MSSIRTGYVYKEKNMLRSYGSFSYAVSFITGLKSGLTILIEPNGSFYFYMLVFSKDKDKKRYTKPVFPVC